MKDIYFQSKSSSRSSSKKSGFAPRTLFKKKKKPRGKPHKSPSSKNTTPSLEAAMTTGQKVVKARTPRGTEPSLENEKPTQAPPVEGQAEQPIGAVPAEEHAEPLPERAAAAGLEPMRSDGPVAMATPAEVMALEAKEDAGPAVKSTDKHAAQLRVDGQPDEGHQAVIALQTAMVPTDKRRYVVVKRAQISSP